MLDECGSCGHIFQNPRLTSEGLDFYYRDFYDGAGSDPTEFVWTADDRSYRGRVDLVRARTEPKRWLDVGAGHGHFCLVASTLLPETEFEALDMGEGILTAEHHGWVERAHLGMFPDLAGTLAGSFDVVSMHHYLEHTRDPLAELDAAATVLEPGGWLSVEVPDPECAFGRWFGPLWGPWFQPQHQHFLSAAELVGRAQPSWLHRRGRGARAGAHPGRPRLLLPFALQPRRRTSPTAMARAGRVRARGPAAPCASRRSPPLAVPAFLLDQAIAPVVRSRPGGPNAYRMLARRT